MRTNRPDGRHAESPLDSHSSLLSFWSWRRFLPVGILLTLGVVFFVSLFFLVRAYERKQQKDLFQRIAQASNMNFSRRAQSDLEALMSVGHFFSASQTVEAKEFEAFVQGPLDWHPEIYSLEWIARVSATERSQFEATNQFTIWDRAPDGSTNKAPDRDFHFPITYKKSSDPSDTQLGEDLGAQPIFRAAMNKALKQADGKLVASTRFNLSLPGQRTNAETAVRVFLPIYDNRTTNPPPYRPESLQGFAAAVLRPSHLLQLSQDTPVNQQLEMRLFDESAPADKELLGYYNPPPSKSPPSPSLRESISLGPTENEPYNLELEGLTWTLVCKPRPDFRSRGDWNAWLVLFGGLLVTLLLSSYFYTLLGQAAYVENVVTHRTGELASMNVRLQNEIGERERGERALRDSEALYHSLVDTLPMNILRKNLRGHITFGNRSYCESMGMKLEDLLGKTDFDLFPHELAEKYVADDRKVIDSGRILEDVEAHRKPNGNLVYMQILKGPVIDAVGRVVGIQVIFWDVTEKKVAEDALRQTMVDLARSNHDLEQFAYVASHDLQEPLRMIASYTELLSKRYQDQLDNEAKEFIGYTVEAAVRIQLLINDLLTYSRLDTRGAKFELVSSEEAFEAALTNLQVPIDEANAQVTHDPLPSVRGDFMQLTQLFQDLLSNAVKFRGEAPPQIHVGVRPLDAEWEFSVRDNGIGIESQFLDRIFVIFQRLHPRSKYTGTGIGLAICKKIVERHGGRIWVESRPGEGTTFFFTLPSPTQS